MLPDDRVALVVPSASDPAPLREALSSAEVWVTSVAPPQVEDQLAAAGSRARVVRVPDIYFPAFHPDILHVVGPDGRALRSAAGDYSSAIVLWGWREGLGADEIRACFTGEVFSILGYTTAWYGSVDPLRGGFEASAVDFAAWLLPLARSGVFMLTDNHPSAAALIGLARLVALELGADPGRVDVPWERLIPDGLLATSTVWPVYPEIAEALGVAGSYVWRTPTGALLDLDTFIERTLDGYRDLDPAALDLPRLVDDPRFAEALGRRTVAS